MSDVLPKAKWGKIGIIVPAYNIEHLIERCIKSLLNQEGANYRIILVNDGSTDKTGIVAEQMATIHSDKLVVLHKGNGGQSSARNMGLQYCDDCQYIAFVDGDDYVAPNYLSKLLHVLIEDDCDISMCSSNRCYGDDGKGKRFDSGFSRDFVSGDIERILEKSSFVPWNKLYKKELWKNIRFPEGITYEDMATIPQVMYKAKKIGYTHEVLYHYFVNVHSTIMSKRETTDRNIIEAQTILEHSELKQQPELLENIYIRRVLTGMCYTLIAHAEDNNLVRELVERAHKNYPDICNNPLIQKASRRNRIYLRLLLGKKYRVCSLYVRTYETIRSHIAAIYHIVKHS